MDYVDFLDRIIDDGIEAAKHDYADNEQMCSGAVAGFEACRGNQPSVLAALLKMAHYWADQAFREEAKDYWYHRCYEAEVEWVCNCVSAALMNEGQPIIIQPTVRGVLKAAQIFGVKEGELV